MNLKVALLTMFGCPLLSLAQSHMASMVVTVGHFDLHDARVPGPEDIIVTSEARPLPVASLTPLRGDRAALELFLLLDHCSNCEAGSQFDDLRKFISSQPATTTIGVAYVEDGCARIVEPVTADRARIIKALHPAGGGKPSSPFTALTELIKGWEPGAARRAVLLISDGIDPEAKSQMDPRAEAAIEEAQRAAVAVHAIYHPSADWATGDASRMSWGQMLLAHVAYETGGQAYFLGFAPLASLAPYLSDISDHFANQYLLECLFKPGAAHGLRFVSVRSAIDGFDVLAPARIWLPGPGLSSEQDAPPQALRRDRP